MKHIMHECNGSRYLIVEVEKEACNFSIKKDPIANWLVGYHVLIPLSRQGNYTPLFIAENATEDEAQGVVSVYNPNSEMLGYMEYDGMYINNGNVSEDWSPYVEAKLSLNSLIRANFTDTTKHHLVLKMA